MGKVVFEEKTRCNQKCYSKDIGKVKENKNSLNKIDLTMVEQLVRDLVIVKAFAVLRLHKVFNPLIKISKFGENRISISFANTHEYG